MASAIGAADGDDAGKLILRLVLGILVLFHGIAKLSGVGDIAEGLQNAGLPGFFAYGVYIGEILGPVLVIIGWHARLGAVLIAINMVVAILLAHSGELFALNQHGGYKLELQAMYLFGAIAVALSGPGRLSLNRR